MEGLQIPSEKGVSGCNLQGNANLQQSQTQFSSGFMERMKHVNVLLCEFIWLLWGARRGSCPILVIVSSLQIIWKSNQKLIQTSLGGFSCLFPWEVQHGDDDSHLTWRLLPKSAGAVATRYHRRGWGALKQAYFPAVPEAGSLDQRAA